MIRTNLFLLCLMASLPVFSQVDTIADNIYEYNGNLGIGLSNPETLLHLRGPFSTGEERNLLRLHNTDDGGLSFTGIKMLTGNSGGFSMITDVGVNYNGSPGYNTPGFLVLANNTNGVILNAGSTNGMIRFLSGMNPSNGGWYERMRITSNGNIGIATENPLSKLEVNGMIHSTSQGFKFPDGTVQTSAANGSGVNYWNSFNNHIYYNQGNVGIGLNNPETSLHVVGQVTSGEQRNLLRLHNTDDGGLSFTGIKMLTGNSGGYSVIMDVGKNYNSSPTYNINGFLGIGNSANGVFLNAEGATGMIRFFAGVNPSNGGWYERMRINHDGNIGIGTINPLSKLEVNGMIHSTSQGYKFPDGTVQTTAVGADSYWSSGSNENIYYNKGPVSISGKNQDPIPYGQLTVFGKDSVDGNIPVWLISDFNESDFGKNTIGRLIRLKQGTGTHLKSFDIGLDNNHSLYFQRVYKNGLYYEPNFLIHGLTGNIGIGIQNPQSKLEVNGMIHSTSEGFKFPDGTIQISAANGSSESYWNSTDNNIYYNNGRVGIGRTNFESYFDTKLWVQNGWLQVTDSTGHDAGIVVNNLSKSGYGFARSLHQVFDGVFGDPYTEFRIRDNDDLSTVVSWSLGIDHADENKLKITNTSNSTTGASPTYGENIISIATNGDVGIGTSRPSAKLEVADGDIYISDINHGIIMKSPNGQCWRGTLDNSGNLGFTSIDCPGEIKNSIESKSDVTNNAFSIYPNPSDNTVSIASLNGLYKNSSALIYTLDGKMIRKNALNTEVSILDLSQIPSGSYIIRVIDKRGKELGSETLIKK